jgi:Mg2+ and Co2+ transporter CorA
VGVNPSATSPIRARLYDAKRPDRDVELTSGLIAGLRKDQLVWVDIDSRHAGQFERIAAILDIPDDAAALVQEELGHARLVRYRDAVHLTVEAIEAADGTDDADESLVLRELDLFARRLVVLTVHEGPVAALQEFNDQLRGDTLIGRLDAGSFLAALVDTMLTTYFEPIEAIERDIDDLDEVALRGPNDDDFLLEVMRLRRRVGLLRRTIAPHREALAPLGRTDIALDEVLGQPQPQLGERLERVIDAVENARELLVGSFDIYLGRAAQRTNEVMKALTVLSAVLLPSVVLAGVMGMNFKADFFEPPSNFWVVIGAMAALAIGILGVARARRWI